MDVLPSLLRLSQDRKYSKEMEKRTANNLYPLQVWSLTLIVIAPIVTTIYTYFSKNPSPLADRYSWIWLLVPFGFFYSIPALLFYYLSFKILAARQLKPSIIRSILCVICIFGIYITFFIIKGSMANLLSEIYSASVILPSYVFKIYQNKAIANHKADNTTIYF
jgi:uncharacterized membrane-anchored protein